MTHRTVRDQMTSDVATVGVGTPYKAVVELLESRRISAAPVLDAEGRVIGVVSEASRSTCTTASSPLPASWNSGAWWTSRPA